MQSRGVRPRWRWLLAGWAVLALAACGGSPGEVAAGNVQDSAGAGAPDPADTPLEPAGGPTLTACSSGVDPSSPVLSNGFAFNGRNTRSNDSGIDSGNVADLRLAFAHAANGSTWKRGAPAVTEQAIFFSAGRDVIAMDRHSGCTFWYYRIPQRYGALLLTGSNGVRSSSIYLLNARPDQPALILVGDFYGSFYAIDAQSGNLLWSRFLGTERAHHWITGGTQYHDGRLFVPVASREVVSVVLDPTLCCTSHGMLQVLDPWTGEIVWTYHATAEAIYQASTGKLGPNGVSLWGTPAIDPARNTVYVGTGQNLTPPYTPNADAIVALDMDSGAQKWIFQSTAEDAWNADCQMPPLLDTACVEPAGSDFDFGAPPILASLPDGSEAVIAGAKNGVVYSIDPDDGALNWSRQLGRGGTLGGIHWGMAADDTRVYAAVSDAHVNKASLLTALVGRPDVLPVADARPGIYALDLASGEIVWQIRPQHEFEGALYDSIYSAALSLSHDVLFAGALDGELRAFHTADGRELWRYDSVHEFTDVNGVPGYGGTIDSVGAVPAGDLLLLNSGYDTFGGSNEYQAGPGNGLFVFELP